MIFKEIGIPIVRGLYKISRKKVQLRPTKETAAPKRITLKTDNHKNYLDLKIKNKTNHDNQTKKILNRTLKRSRQIYMII